MTKESIDNNRLQGWVVNVFKLPKGTGVTASERECNGEQHSSIVTDVAVHLGKDHLHKYIIPKPLVDITYEDIKLLRTTIKTHAVKKHPILGHLFRFFGWWFAFSGLYSMFAVCPFCGRVGCPVGAGSAGLVGGFFALCMQNWKTFFKFIYSKLFRRS
jgi:hypothetical protein